MQWTDTNVVLVLYKVCFIQLNRFLRNWRSALAGTDLAAHFCLFIGLNLSVVQALAHKV